MRVLIIGGDGYLGWPTAMHFSKRGDDVCVIDSFDKRRWELEEGVEPLLPIPTLQNRIRTWKKETGLAIELRVGDICNQRFLHKALEAFKPEAIVHYGEQPSAPYSMESREKAVYTQVNNVVGTLNLLFAMRRYTPKAHLVKLGTMGEYGTPNIAIEEGWITIEHEGRKDTMLYPKKPGSFYHLSKVHDSANIEFACRIWGMAATDLNQGVVYGIRTPEIEINPALRTSFHYDHIFGTVLNRFLVQAAIGEPLTVYGKGGQTRGFLDLRDTIQCVALACDNPAAAGEFRVLNQFTEQFSVNDLAAKVSASAKRAGVSVKIENLPNPRVELEQHFYQAKHSKLLDLGLKPHLLTDDAIDAMFEAVRRQVEHVERSIIRPTIKWAQ